jgi:hypothetical protein
LKENNPVVIQTTADPFLVEVNSFQITVSSNTIGIFINSTSIAKFLIAGISLADRLFYNVTTITPNIYTIDDVVAI